MSIELANKTLYLIDNLPTLIDIRYPQMQASISPQAMPVMIYSHGFKGFKNWGFIPYLCQKTSEKLPCISISIDYSHNGIVDDKSMIYDAEVFARNTVSTMLIELEYICSSINDILNYINIRHLWNGKIILAGHSLGAALSIITANQLKEKIDALVLWGSIGTLERNTERQKEHWKKNGIIEMIVKETGQKLHQNVSYLLDKENNKEKFNLLQSVRNFNKSTLILHGEQDFTVKCIEAENLFDNCNNAISELHILPKTAHTFGAFHPLQSPIPRVLDDAIDISIKFLSNLA